MNHTPLVKVTATPAGHSLTRTGKSKPIVISLRSSLSCRINLVKRKKLPNIPEDADFDLRISTGKKEFFLNRNPRGLVFGPISPDLKSGRDDHLTLGENENGEFQIHRTVDSQKVWWHTEESIKNEFGRFWRSHSEELDAGILIQPRTYVISFRRLIAVLSVFNILISITMSLFGRLIPKFDIIQLSDNRFMIAVELNRERTIRLARAMTIPLVLGAKILSRVPPPVLEKVFRKSFKLFVVKSSSELAILISPLRLGLVKATSQNKLSFMSLDALGTLYQAIESNVPLGKLSELGYLGKRATLDLRLKKESKSIR